MVLWSREIYSKLEREKALGGKWMSWWKGFVLKKLVWKLMMKEVLWIALS